MDNTASNFFVSIGFLRVAVPLALGLFSAEENESRCFVTLNDTYSKLPIRSYLGFQCS
jgi:hypothetical protein